MDETNRVRLWVERRGDGGFWETESTRDTDTTTQTSLSQREMEVEGEEDEEMGIAFESSPDRGGDIGWRMTRPPSPAQRTARSDYAGVRLTNTAGVSAWMQQPTLSWGSGCDGSSSSTSSAVGPGSAGGTTLAEERILVFLKSVGLSEGKSEESYAATGAVGGAKAGGPNRKLGISGGGGATGRMEDDNSPRYLTHAVLREKSPLRSLFELAADLLPDVAAPEELGAYVEDLPWAWQSAALGQQAAESKHEADCATAAAAESRFSRSPFSTGGAPPIGRRPASCRRFLVCPASLPPVPPSSTKRQKRSGVGVACGVHAAGGREDGQGSVALTLKEAGLSSGASICFFRAGRDASVRKIYGALVEGLVESMRVLLRREGPLGRVHHIKVIGECRFFSVGTVLRASISL